MCKLVFFLCLLVIKLCPLVPRCITHTDITRRCHHSNALSNQLTNLIDTISISTTATLASHYVASLKTFRQLLDLTILVSECKYISLLACNQCKLLLRFF